MAGGRVYLNSNLQNVPSGNLNSQLQYTLQDLENQLNSGPAISSLVNASDPLPTGMQSGDLVFNSQGGELKVGIFDGTNVNYASFGSFTGAITDAQHGTRSGGNLHPAATDTVAGFMSAPDKSKLDNFLGFLSVAGAISITQLPHAGQWCFYTDTTGPTNWLAANYAGAIKSVQLT